ncbi:response regulator, partial [bacterium]|nr:response regulator [candidate division CSSED10-310 bacterium]
ILENEIYKAKKCYQTTGTVFTLFTLQLESFNQDELEGRITRLLKSSFKDLRFFLKDGCSKYYLICQCQLTPAVLQQYKRNLKQILLESQNAKWRDFSYKLLEYPSDSLTPESMFEKIDEGLLHEIKSNHASEILIVDDESSIQDTLNRILRQAGYRHVYTASNGMQALTRIEKRVPDLIILDMRMPEMSGYELLGRLKENPVYRAIPVILMSGFPIKEDLLTGTEYAPDIIKLNKPIMRDDLLNNVYYLL